MIEEKVSLSKDKIAEFKEAFDLFDKDKDQEISVVELGQIFNSIGYNPTLDELKEMIMDEEGRKKDKITFEDFLSLMAIRIKDEDTEKELIEAFKYLDKEGKGLIHIQDLKNTMLQFGETLSPEELETIIKEADDDEDGYIKYEDLVKNILYH
jgi:calmodulin